MSKFLRSVFIAVTVTCIVAVFLFAGLTVFVMVFAPDTPATETSLAVMAQPAAPAEELPILLPTVTPQPVPTSTPRPTATPDTTVAYDEATAAIAADYIDVTDAFALLWNRASADPYLMLTDTWRAELDSEIAKARALNVRIRALNPPSDAAYGHSYFVSFADHMDRALTLQEQGLDTLDPALLMEANGKMDAANADLNIALGLLFN